MPTLFEHFTTDQVSKITGFSTRQLDYWAKTELLVPSVCQSNGPGTRKQYNFDDLVRLHFIKQLRGEGWSIQKIRKAIAHLEEFMQELPSYRNFRLIPDKGTILVLCETQENQQILLDILNPQRQQVLWIVLELLRTEAQEKTHQLFDVYAKTDVSTHKAV